MDGMATRHVSAYRLGMDALRMASERAQVRRRIIVLDDEGTIILTQAGSPIDDRAFGFTSRAKRLPSDLEASVRLAIATEGYLCSGAIITQFLGERNMALRVFPLKRGDRTHVGLILEVVRRRAAD
jgi:hypothetical protein